MNTETANTKLYEKMFEEQEKFRGWLLSQPPKEILNHTYEYTTREDILMTLENNDLRLDQAQALLSSPTPLADVRRTIWMWCVIAWRAAPIRSFVGGKRRFIRIPVRMHGSMRNWSSTGHQSVQILTAVTPSSVQSRITTSTMF